jgi:excisionase family DNA binding protein
MAAAQVIPEGDTALTVSQCALITGMSLAYWRTQVRLKNIDYLKIGRAVRIRKSALARFLADREVTR